jgi:hypothetical protein
MVRATSITWASRSGSRSIQWSTSSTGTTSVWPGASGAMVRKATARSSCQTKRPGISPWMMRVNSVAMGPDPRTTYGPAVADPSDEHADGEDRILTLPNIITVVRLCMLPVFLWLLFSKEDRVWAASILGALGATDFLDGYIARHWHQVSNIGKILDPVADRLLFFVGGLAIIIDGSIPLWVAWLVLIREVLVSVATVALAPGRGQADRRHLVRQGRHVLRDVRLPHVPRLRGPALLARPGPLVRVGVRHPRPRAGLHRPRPLRPDRAEGPAGGACRTNG